jgi:putative FmdB family regulatory protein
LPTYSYKCTECGTAFDIQQAFTDDSLTECPNCGGKLRKVFTAIGVSFNGSGFYRNDSRATTRSSENAGSPKASESKSSESKTSESKSDGGKSSDTKSQASKPTSSAPSTPAASPSKAAG